MNKTFLNQSRPMLTVMLQCETPETAIGRIRNANMLGADAYGLQVESLKHEYHNPDTYKKIFVEMKGRPCYVTNYRSANNAGKTDDELAEGLVVLAQSGATLCDVVGDLFCKHPEELTEDSVAIEKQMALIETLHCLGAEVLMSSHIHIYTPAERVLEIALEHQRRGADISKIVTGAETEKEEIENLKIVNMLKEKLDIPFLFLCNGKCRIFRKIAGEFGNCMYLCVYEHDEISSKNQPLLKNVKAVRDNL